jgi:hypothetical protein
MVDTKTTTFRTGLKNGEIEIVEMESDLLKLSILAGRGADLVQIIYKPRNFNLAWQSSFGWPDKKTPVNHPADVDSFVKGYPGGWQSIFPNGGAPSKYKEIEFGQHDEVAMLTWTYEVVVDDENEISIKFETQTHKLKFLYEKTFTLKRGISKIFLSEKIKNLTEETVHTMWGNHITFGEPFIDEFSSIILGGKARVLPHDLPISSAGRRLKSNQEFQWPKSIGEDGSLIDFSRIPPKKTKSEMLYLCDLMEANYLVSSPTIGLSVRVSWDRETFPYLWFWQEFGCAEEYPWFGKHFNIGLEPFSSYPTNGLAEAVTNGSALVFEPNEEKTSSIEYEVLELS